MKPGFRLVWMRLKPALGFDATMKASELIRRLERAGWVTLRHRGSHRVMAHPDKPGKLLVVPDHGSRELPTGTAMRLLREAELR